MIPTVKNISLSIEPNYSSWQTIELSYLFAKKAIDNNVEGIVVECGVACGNNFAAMCKAGRFGIGFDSFEGIPWAGVNDEEQPGIGQKTVQIEWHDKLPVKNYILGGLVEDSISSGVTSHTIEDATLNMTRWGIEDYEFVKGWFQNTVPLHPIDKISVLRLDGDLYDSTYIPLKYLWPKVSKGGFLIIDDWNLSGCRKAVYDYFSEIGENPSELFQFGNPKYFQK